MRTHNRHSLSHPIAVNTPDFSAIINSPLGKLGISINAEHLICGIRFVDENIPLFVEPTIKNHLAFIALTRYFSGSCLEFSLPYQLAGTPFQQRVWQTLFTTVPTGQTITYQELADLLQSGPRAVANACRHNPLPIIIPCHRVVAKNGLGGYSGENTEGKFIRIKRWLLQHENGTAPISH